MIIVSDTVIKKIILSSSNYLFQQNHDLKTLKETKNHDLTTVNDITNHGSIHYIASSRHLNVQFQTDFMVNIDR